MIIFNLIDVWGLEGAMEGMRNPKNSWGKSDSSTDRYGEYYIGPVDLSLAQRLCGAGTEHRKFLRMIHIQANILAPLYWWKEFDTYKVGTTANSCSTMHKLTSRDLVETDFSMEHLLPDSMASLRSTICMINKYRKYYGEADSLESMYSKKECWWQMIQLLPSSYNQKRTVDFDYETALSIICQRKDHKQDEWRDLCGELLRLPYMKEFYGMEVTA